MALLTEVFGKNFTLSNASKRINGVQVEIKKYIDVDTFANIVYTVANSCFQNDGYHAENREISRRFVILKYLTDIEVDESNIEEIFKCTQGGNWYAQIEAEVIKLPIWGEIEQAIDRQIDYLVMTRPTAFDKLCSDLSDLVTSNKATDLAEVKDVLDKLSKVDKKAFVDEVINSNIAKNKGGESNVKKPKRANSKAGSKAD